MRKVNLIACSIFLLATIYFTSLAAFHRKFLDPLGDKELNGSLNSKDVDLEHSAMSMVILWIAAIIAGHIMFYIRLPTLLGVLLCGMILKNVPVISNSLVVNDELKSSLRKAAFAVILIRGGIGLDSNALKKNKGIILRLGILSPIIEALAIIGAAFFILHFDLKMAILYGMTLAATSPAVTIPTMIGLNKKGYGSASGVPTVLLAAAAIDNMICLTAAEIALEFIFTDVEIWMQLGNVLLQIVLGIIAGFAAGMFMWYFPNKANKKMHFIRTSMLLWISLLFIFGGEAVEMYSGGVIATIIVSICASYRWKVDNANKSELESNAFALMWNLLGLQIMFVLIGFGFDLSVLDWLTVLKGLGILLIGVIVRFCVAFLLSFGSGFTRLEQIFMSIAFFPKATVQAALIPLIVSSATGTVYSDDSMFVLQSCVIAIIITAPLGQFVLQLFGPVALKSENIYEVQSDSQTDHRIKLSINPVSLGCTELTN